MDFINRGFSSILVLALVFVGIVFLINVLPVILVIGAGVWGISYLVKAIKNWNANRNGVFKGKADDIEIIKNETSEDFSKANVIDVDYTDV